MDAALLRLYIAISMIIAVMIITVHQSNPKQVPTNLQISKHSLIGHATKPDIDNCRKRKRKLWCIATDPK